MRYGTDNVSAIARHLVISAIAVLGLLLIQSPVRAALDVPAKARGMTTNEVFKTIQDAGFTAHLNTDSASTGGMDEFTIDNPPTQIKLLVQKCTDGVSACLLIFFGAASTDSWPTEDELHLVDNVSNLKIGIPNQQDRTFPHFLANLRVPCEGIQDPHFVPMVLHWYLDNLVQARQAYGQAHVWMQTHKTESSTGQK